MSPVEHLIIRLTPGQGDGLSEEESLIKAVIRHLFDCREGDDVDANSG
jgi:hypothetical protein